MKSRKLVEATGNCFNRKKTKEMEQIYFTSMNFFLKRIFGKDYRCCESLAEFNCPACTESLFLFCFLKKSGFCYRCGFRSTVTRLFFLSLTNFIGGKKR